MCFGSVLGALVVFVVSWECLGCFWSFGPWLRGSPGSGDAAQACSFEYPAQCGAFGSSGPAAAETSPGCGGFRKKTSRRKRIKHSQSAQLCQKHPSGRPEVSSSSGRRIWQTTKDPRPRATSVPWRSGRHANHATLLSRGCLALFSVFKHSFRI